MKDVDPTLVPQNPTAETTQIITSNDFLRQHYNSVGKLEAGTVIEGFNNLEEIDRAFVKVADYLGVGLALPRNTKKPSRALKPPKFFGKIEDLKLVLLSELHQVPKDDHGEAHLGVFGLLTSTGRGIVGNIAKDCTISLRPTVVANGTYPNYPGYRPTRYSYADLPGSTSEKGAALLNQEAAWIATKVVMDGMRHAYVGGLPGQRKRS